MIHTSDKWIPALRSPTRKEKIELVIMVREPRIYKYTDKDIVQGSLYISQKVMGSNSFKIGTCETQELGVSLVEDRAKEINYGGALVIVRYSLCVGIDENGEEIWETVPKNTSFFVDGTKTKRKGNIVTLKAYDPASLLDIELPKDQIPYGSLYKQAKWIWEYAATHIAPTNSDSNTSVHIAYGFMSEEDFNALPNTDVSADFSSGQIVSCRDALMWVAQLTCSYVMFKANENNDENILTFKRHRYDGNMKNEREITAQERQNIEFTDTRTYCTYLLAYSGDDQKIYTEKVDYNESWDPQYINPGCVSLPKNPLVARLTTEEQDQINKAIQHYTTHPIRYIKMTGNVDFALELLDVVAFTGGTIDIRKKIIAPVTEIRWKYRGIGTIICNQIPEYSDKSGEETETLHSSPAKMAARNYSQNSAAYSPVISQRDKELAIARRTPDRLVSNNVTARLYGHDYGGGHFELIDGNASYSQKYLAYISFENSQYTGPTMNITTGDVSRPNRTEIRIEDSLRVLCQKGTIQYGDDKAYPNNGSPDQGRICLNADDSGIYPAMIKLSTFEGYTYSIKFSPDGVTFSNGAGGSFTIPFAAEATEEEEQQ